jgi:transposase
MRQTLSDELKQLTATIRDEAREIDAITRLITIPAVGLWVSVTIYAWVGDVSRFPSARHLAAYAGLVPSVWQSGDSERSGGITKQRSPALLRWYLSWRALGQRRPSWRGHASCASKAWRSESQPPTTSSS